MQEYVEKAYNIFLFLCTNSIKKRFKSKKLKNYAQFKKIVALSNLIQRRYHNDIRNMLP